MAHWGWRRCTGAHGKLLSAYITLDSSMYFVSVGHNATPSMEQCQGFMSTHQPEHLASIT
jgi:hypothetical protein